MNKGKSLIKDEVNDLINDDHIGQLGFLYSLFLLNKYGKKERNVEDYCGFYFLAFPSFTENYLEDWQLDLAFEARFINRFAVWFGFAEEKISTKEDSFGYRQIKVVKKKFLDKFLSVQRDT